jgi:hypothetical protein
LGKIKKVSIYWFAVLARADWCKMSLRNYKTIGKVNLSFAICQTGVSQSGGTYLSGNRLRWVKQRKMRDEKGR